MKKIFFENAKLFFQDFYIGVISDEIEFHGSSPCAAVEKISQRKYAQVQSSDLVLRFALKEKSDDLKTLTCGNSPCSPDIKQLLSDFGTITISDDYGNCLKIKDVFWIRFPVAEFQLKRNAENAIHTLYFLWSK